MSTSFRGKARSSIARLAFISGPIMYAIDALTSGKTMPMPTKIIAIVKTRHGQDVGA